MLVRNFNQGLLESMLETESDHQIFVTLRIYCSPNHNDAVGEET